MDEDKFKAYFYFYLKWDTRSHWQEFPGLSAVVFSWLTDDLKELLWWGRRLVFELDIETNLTWWNETERILYIELKHTMIYWGKLASPQYDLLYLLPLSTAGNPMLYKPSFIVYRLIV